MKKFDVVVTRHTQLIQYLKEIRLVDETTRVVSHATVDNVAGKDVCGVLPHSLSSLTKSFTEVPLNLPPELRGVELTLEQIRQHAGDPVTYRVFTDSSFKESLYCVSKSASADGCCAPIDWSACFY